MNTTTPTREEQATNQYRQDRDHDRREADRKWATKTISEWHNMLDDKQTAGPHPELKALIRENLAIRDALIIASIDKTRTTGQLVSTVVNAHSARTKLTMQTILRDAYTTGQFDRQRCSKAIQLVDQLAETEDAYSAQPLAIAAWLEWISGNTLDAMTHAAHALTLDEDCTLAAIIHAASSQGMRPAYLD